MKYSIAAMAPRIRVIHITEHHVLIVIDRGERLEFIELERTP